MSQHGELQRIAQYIRDLEKERNRYMLEAAQLRSSHSFRLGQAFVLYLRDRRFLAVGKLLREIRAAMKPQNASVATPKPRTFPLLSGKSGTTAITASAPVLPISAGTQILRKAAGKAAVVVLGTAETERRAGENARVLVPAYDRFDADWDATAPQVLVLDPDGLASRHGWRHALTLADASATIELVRMLKLARQRGMRTVLVEPREAWRFPLLSRILPLFDERIAGDDQSTATRIAEMARRAA